MWNENSKIIEGIKQVNIWHNSPKLEKIIINYTVGLPFRIDSLKENNEHLELSRILTIYVFEISSRSSNKQCDWYSNIS